jgi:hypothetical protein
MNVEKNVIEEWRDIPGYEGFYQVSDAGRVKRLAGLIHYPDSRAPYPRNEIVLRSSPGTHGYPFVDLSVYGYRKRMAIHVLVCMTFHGPNPGGMEVCHGDGSRSNATKENLRWDTRSSNQLDRRKHGTSNAGSKNALSKLTDSKVIEIKRLLAAKEMSQSKIGAMFGVGQSVISLINLGQRWAHVQEVV